MGVANAAGKMTLGQVSEVGDDVADAPDLSALPAEDDLSGGSARWSVRYVLLAFGNAGDLSILFYPAILLHGICYDFFFMTGQLYTDQEAPAHFGGTAQGFMQFLTYGVGMFIGSLLSGGAVDFLHYGCRRAVTRNWAGFWLRSAAGAFPIFLLVALLFQSRAAWKRRWLRPQRLLDLAVPVGRSSILPNLSDVFVL